MAAQLNFRIRVYKNVAANAGNEEWSNEYDIRTPEAVEITDAALSLAVQNIVDFERAIHTWEIGFKRAVISTQFENDLVTQDASRTVGLAAVGGRQGDNRNNNAIDLSRVLIINFSGSNGRSSRHQYRGAVDNQSSLPGIFGAFLNEGQRQGYVIPIQNLLNSPTGALLQIATIKDDVITTRPVTSITLSGIGNRQRTARRKPRISLDEDAIVKRLTIAVKEIALINASIATRLALGGFDVTKQAALLAAVAQIKAQAENIDTS